jgi:hypothetical protein
MLISMQLIMSSRPSSIVRRAVVRGRYADRIRAMHAHARVIDRMRVKPRPSGLKIPHKY